MSESKSTSVPRLFVSILEIFRIQSYAIFLRSRIKSLSSLEKDKAITACSFTFRPEWDCA
jgi:hypothetical protein